MSCNILQTEDYGFFAFAIQFCHCNVLLIESYDAFALAIQFYQL